MLTKFGMVNCKPLDTSISKVDKFNLNQYPQEWIWTKGNAKYSYAYALGSLLYAQVCT